MAFASSVKSSKAVSSIIVDTKAALEGMTKVAPAGIWFLESDTGVMKVSDGVSLYSALPNKVEALFTSSFKTLLDNANAANGVAKLDASGKLTMGMLPEELTSSVLSGAVKYVADIAARDALTEKGGMVIVVDASADASVAAGTAGYAWNGEAWTKVFESESMDVSLADYFAMSVNTLDDVQDGTTYVKMAATWKASVDSDLSDLKGRLTTAEATLVTHGTDIATAQAAAEAAQGDIDAHKEAYATDKAALEAAIATADGKGAQGIADAATAQAAAEAAQGAADAVAGRMDTAESNIEGLQGQIDAITGVGDGDATSIASLAGRLTAVENLATANTTLAQQGIEAAGVAQGEVDALEGVVAALTQTVADNKSAAETGIQEAKADAAAVAGRMDTAEGEIDTLQANAYQTTDTIYFAPMSAAELEAALA